jgi:hypothetical protein
MFRANHVAAFLPFVAAVAAALLSGAPASAQSNSIRQGVLTCQTSASVGLIVGSRQRLRCQFKSETGRTQIMSVLSAVSAWTSALPRVA